MDANTETMLMQREDIQGSNALYKIFVQNPAADSGQDSGGNTFTELTASPPPNDDIKQSQSDFFCVDESNLPPYMKVQEVKRVQEAKQQAAPNIIDFQQFIQSNPSMMAEIFAKYQQQQQQPNKKSEPSLKMQTQQMNSSVIQNTCQDNLEAKSSTLSQTFSQASSIESKDEHGRSCKFDPSKLVYKVDEPENEQADRFHREMIHPNMNKYAAKFDICSIHPRMKKNHISLKDQEHLCDSCIISEKYRDHPTAPLSKIALDIYSQFSQHFKVYQNNLEEIKRIDAKNWMVNLRKNYLGLFDDLFHSLHCIRDTKLTEINQAFKKIDVEEVNQTLNSMKVSHDLAKSYQSILQTMFDHNQYSSIAARSVQFNMIGDSMQHLVKDCYELVELASNKRRKLDSLSDKMKDLVSSLKSDTEDRLKQISRDLSFTEGQTQALKNQLNKEDANLIQQRKEARTGFYYFLKDQRDKLSSSNPQLKQIEVIAFLQAKWNVLSAEEKLAYEMTESQSKIIINPEKIVEEAKQTKEQKQLQEPIQISNLGKRSNLDRLSDLELRETDSDARISKEQPHTPPPQQEKPRAKFPNKACTPLKKPTSPQVSLLNNKDFQALANRKRQQSTDRDFLTPGKKGTSSRQVQPQFGSK